MLELVLRAARRSAVDEGRHRLAPELPDGAFQRGPDWPGSPACRFAPATGFVSAAQPLVMSGERWGSNRQRQCQDQAFERRPTMSPALAEITSVGSASAVLGGTKDRAETSRIAETRDGSGDSWRKGGHPDNSGTPRPSTPSRNDHPPTSGTIRQLDGGSAADGGMSGSMYRSPRASGGRQRTHQQRLPRTKAPARRTPRAACAPLGAPRPVGPGYRGCTPLFAPTTALTIWRTGRRLTTFQAGPTPAPTFPQILATCCWPAAGDGARTSRVSERGCLRLGGTAAGADVSTPALSRLSLRIRAERGLADLRTVCPSGNRCEGGSGLFAR